MNKSKQSPRLVFLCAGMSLCAQSIYSSDLPPCLNPMLQMREHNQTQFSIAVDSSMPGEENRCSVIDEDPTGERSIADCTHKWVSGCVSWYSNGALTENAKIIMAKHGWNLPQEESIDLPDGSRFVGEVKDGKPEGAGTLYLANGARYSGRIHEGLLHGIGNLAYSDGKKLQCEWLYGLPNGRCTLRFANGLEAQGDWKNGVEPVSFSEIYVNRDVYYGNISSTGLREGCGTMTSRSSGRVKGYWHEDKLVKKIDVGDDDLNYSACLVGQEAALKIASDRELASQTSAAWLADFRRRQNHEKERDAETAQLLFQTVGILAKGYTDSKAIQHGQAIYDPASGITTYKSASDRAAEQQQIVQQQQILKEQHDFAAQQLAVQQQQEYALAQQAALSRQRQMLQQQSTFSQTPLASTVPATSGHSLTSNQPALQPSYTYADAVVPDNGSPDQYGQVPNIYAVNVTNTGQVRLYCTADAKAQTYNQTIKCPDPSSCQGVTSWYTNSGTSYVSPGSTARVVGIRYYAGQGSYTVNCQASQ